MKIPELKELIKKKKLGTVSGKNKAALISMLQPQPNTQKEKQSKQSNKTVVNVYVSGQQEGQIPVVTQTQSSGKPQVIKPNFIKQTKPSKKFATVKIPGTDPTKPVAASFSNKQPKPSNVGKLNLNPDFTSKLAGLFA